MSRCEKIDFVILWVDGNDPEWQKRRQQYSPEVQDDARVQRYRNWDNLQYFFRGVEKFAPWVNKVFFVTCGQIPEWLDTNHPKLRLIKHDEFMPEEYLPTFNSNAIELMLNRIEELSEHFVLFNDDIFLIKPTKDTDFFRKGLPCDTACLNIHSIILGKVDNYCSLHATAVINKYFDMKKSIFSNASKWFNPIYGAQMLRTVYLLPCKAFPEIRQLHLPCSYLKTTFDTIWEHEGKLLDDTCRHRFRNKLDYSHWVMRNWQIAKGEFCPRRGDFGRSFEIDNSRESLIDCIRYIRHSKGKVICMNDGNLDDKHFAKYKDVVNSELDKILPDRCSFEKETGRREKS
jgi:hypothetical protein